MNLKILSITFLIFGITSCSSSNLVRIASESESCDFSLIEQKKIVRFMVESIEESSFIKSEAVQDQKPFWILGPMINDTDEHINTTAIMESVQAELIKKGIARFVDQKTIESLTTEKKYNSSYDADSFVIAKLTGAKLILRSRISNYRKNEPEKTINSYLLTYQIIAIETSQIIWANESNPAVCVKNRNKERESLHLKNRSF